MAENKKPKNLSALSSEPTGDTIRHAVVVSAGPGARLLELTRSGPGRRGVEAWVGPEPVVWLTTDRSALMPVSPGNHLVTFSVTGVEGRSWDLRVSLPASASGGSNGTVPPDSDQPLQGVFQASVP